MLVGRGLGFAVALEAALKLKETCAIQGEAFSGAEIRHGPMALIDEGYPLLVFALRGAEQKGLVELATYFRKNDARVVLAAPADVGDRDSPSPSPTTRSSTRFWPFRPSISSRRRSRSRAG